MLKGFTRNFKPLEILTEEQVNAIYRGTLDVLWETGVTFHHERALKLFEKNGCKVDYEKKRVKFPPGLVEESLRKAPSSFRVKARDPKDDLIVGGDNVYFMSSPGMRIVDLDTWQTRVATRKENYDAVKILDALPNHHLFGSYTPYFGFEGVPPVMVIPESCAAKIRNSTKCQRSGGSENCEIFTIQMATAVGGMEIFGQCESSPPLTYYKDAVENAFRIVEAGFPQEVGSGIMMGGTGPATITGSLVSGNVEIMAAIVLAQLIKPGARILVGVFVFPQDMRTGSPAFGDIGISLYNVMFNQIWRKYRIPIGNWQVGYASSKQIDFQCGYEKAIGVLIAALSGANIIQLHGGIYGELGYHPVQSILDDDIAGMIGRFIGGVEVNNETLALDLINEVGPIPGHYLNRAHTRKWWKKEQFVPKVADRLPYPEWMKTGKKTSLDYAKQKMEKILATHNPVPLTEDQDKEIEKILKEARKYYKTRGKL